MSESVELKLSLTRSEVNYIISRLHLSDGPYVQVAALLGKIYLQANEQIEKSQSAV